MNPRHQEILNLRRTMFMELESGELLAKYGGRRGGDHVLHRVRPWSHESKEVVPR